MRRELVEVLCLYQPSLAPERVEVSEPTFTPLHPRWPPILLLRPPQELRLLCRLSQFHAHYSQTPRGEFRIVHLAQATPTIRVIAAVPQKSWPMRSIVFWTVFQPLQVPLVSVMLKVRCPLHGQRAVRQVRTISLRYGLAQQVPLRHLP